MGKFRRGGFIFVAWKSDRPPRHVHVYRDGKLVLKWDLDNSKPMKGRATPRVLKFIAELEAEGSVMKIRSVKHNNRKKVFEIRISAKAFVFPYAKADPKPTPDNPVKRVFVDEELGGDGFTYELETGLTGTVHGEQVLEYNQDPNYMRDLLLYKLTLEARKRIDKSPLSKREIIRRLGTSAAQLYRLLDQTNYRKSVDQLLSLLQVLECDVDLVVREKTA